MLSELARRGIGVTCISCTTEPQESVDEAAVWARGCGFGFIHVRMALDEQVLLRKLRSVIAPMSEMDRIPVLRAVLEAELDRGYDLLHVEHLFTSWLTVDMPRSITFVHNLDVADWAERKDLSPRELVTLVQMRRATTHLLRRSQRLIVNSDRVADEIASTYHRARPEVVPLAIDPNLYPWIEQPRSGVVGLIGSMNHYPSRAAAIRLVLRLWPSIHAEVPDARCLVGGRYAERFLAGLPKTPGLEILPRIDDAAEFFGGISILLYPPPTGTGMKVKVLEAMAYGVPVLSNDLGLEGLEGLDITEEGSVAMRSETDGEFVDSAVRLLRDSALRERLRVRARGLLESRYSPKPVIDRLLYAYHGLGLLADADV